VAPTSFTAAGIAKADPLRVTNLTFLYSLPAWLVPYIFAYSPELILIGAPAAIAVRVITSLIAIAAMAVSFHGYLLNPLRWAERGAFLITGLFLVHPHWLSDVVGYALLVVIVVWQLISHRARRRGSQLAA
jgi:TRAP-type uncharacterized transport system fused permease subunit